MIDNDRTAVAQIDVLMDGATMARMLTTEGPPEKEQVEYLLDVLAAAPDEALDFVAGQVECHTARGGDLDPLVAALRSRARGIHARAAAAFVAARAAEGAGESETARHLIDQVLDLRPDLVPALRDAAGYAAARGDYLTADGHLRRTGSPNSLQPGVAEVLAATDMGDIPRNSPCPCGSGRKFKVCCRRGAVPSLGTRAQLLYALLGNYGERAPGVEIVRRLAGDTTDHAHLMFCLDLAIFPGGLVDRFLAARGQWLRPDERDLIDRWRAVPITLYEVVEVRRDAGVTLRALPGGAPVHVADRLFSTCVTRHQLFCGRLLHDDSSPRILALPVVVARNRCHALLNLLAAAPSAEGIASFLSSGIDRGALEPATRADPTPTTLF